MPATIENEKIAKRLTALGWAVTGQGNYTLPAVIRRFQAAHLEPTGERLTVDGIVGPKTLAALFEAYKLPAGYTLSSRALAVAISQIGIAESPLGSNTGPQVNMYHKAVGVATGNPWCMSLQYWCFGQAARQLGVKNPLPQSAHCLTVYNRAVKDKLPTYTAAQIRSNPSLVKPGMIPIWIIAPLTGAGHTANIVAVDETQWTTVEGNSNINGEREGLIVARQTKRKATDKILHGMIGLF
ncbi:MAG TPA: peptidoglycan-binding domain-containing protein [Fibrella sp.]|jgi:hypothetical protein